MSRSKQRYMLRRKLPGGQVKSWSEPMRPAEARRAVFFCLTDNAICPANEAKPVAVRLEDHPADRVGFGGYEFWLEPVEDCEQVGEVVQHWCAGSNRVGYLPESPENVMHGGTIADAVAHVQAELEFDRDRLFDGDDEQALTGAVAAWAEVDQAEAERLAARSRTDGYHSVTVAGVNYWIQPCYTEGCDQVG